MDYDRWTRWRKPGQFSVGLGPIGALFYLAVLVNVGCGSSAGNKHVTGDGSSDSGSVDGSGHGDASAVGHPMDASANVCPGDAGAGAKGKSEACNCDGECRTGFCVNGVCCSSACTDTCKACNLPSSLGDCSFVPSGVSPSDPLECPADKALTCGRDGTCDGAGACRKYLAGTDCKPGTCAGDSITGALTCDGNGACSQSATTPCFPYTCDPTTNQCAEACTTNGQCAAGQSCFAQSCGKKLNGTVAKSVTECLSTYLANGVCCNVGCNGPCVSCSQTGSVGRCKPIDPGLPDPGNQCAKNDPSSCGTTGLCDGSGACAMFPANTPCAPASCSGAVLSDTAQSCDGKGTCQAANLVDCSPYLCSNGACNGSCRTDSDCEDGHACVATQVRGVSTGACAGKKKNGQPCADPSECDSSECVDGFCCESSCDGACRSCGLPGSLGQCVDVAAGAPDPRKTCSDAGKASCGTNGMCDGSGACQKYPVGFVCGQDTCVLGAHTPPATCNAAGQCVTPPSQTCFPYACNGQVCYRSCTSGNTECAAGNLCVSGSCGFKSLGADCSNETECKSGYCAQGVCCNSGCNGACQACNLTSSLGLCTEVVDGAPDPQGLCTATPQASCGTTGLCASGKCAFVAEGYSCKASSCATGSSETPASTCDGLGSCVTPPNQSCGTFICSSAACESICKTDKDCVTPNTCVGNSCGLKPIGAACTDGTQCDSSFCTEGVCCNTACSDAATGGLCLSCKVSGKAGTCSPVAAGGADPKKLCVASNALGGDCSNDGTCNGAGACRAWSTATACRLASCGGSTFSPPAYCDGSGHCPAPVAQGCNPYQCSGTSPSCLTTCTADSDCTDKLTCLKINNQCGTKLSNGQGCKADADCNSNFCTSEGVCCNSACGGACQSCVLSGKVGTCSNIAASGTPRDSSTCAAGSNVCGNTSKCDGKGGCQIASAGLTCGAASCAPPVSGTLNNATVAESLARIPAPTCNGSGTCVPADAVSCGNFQCDASALTCKTSCSTSSVDCNAIAPSTTDPNGGNSCVSGTCQKKPNGSTCTSGFACVSGNCLNGFCCGSASCDDGLACTTDACTSSGTCGHAIAATNCAIGGVCFAAGTVNPVNACQQCTPTISQMTWSPRPIGTVCRAAAGPCDTAEVCDGTGAACPADGFAAATTVCRASVGACDVAEKCTGTSATCPADGFAAATTVCRASAGTCDVAEKCTGTSATCPVDGFAAATTVCRASAGACDVAESCTGTSATCPADGFAAATTVCRASAGACDVAEKCTGASAACPADGFAAATTVCRASAGACDVAESCTGTSAGCPADAFAPATTVCRASAGLCDMAESCTGASATCPTDLFAPKSTVCRASAGTCDVAESCTGTSATCPTDALAPATTVCRASAGTCDVAESCTGASATCPTDGFAPATTVCRASAGACDVAESCTGASATCPTDAFASTSVVCRPSADVCDVAENCTGSGAACPDDGFASISTVCRPSTGPCDAPENCTGIGAACPSDIAQPDNTPCDLSNVCATCLAGSCTGTLDCGGLACDPVSGCPQ